MKGIPGCPECNGNGGHLTGGRFVVCDCVRTSQAALRAQHQRRINDPRYMPVWMRDELQRRKGQ